MKARRLPGVRCSTLNTPCKSLLCLMIMPGRSCVAGIAIIKTVSLGSRTRRDSPDPKSRRINDSTLKGGLSVAAAVLRTIRATNSVILLCSSRCCYSVFHRYVSEQGQRVGIAAFLTQVSAFRTRVCMPLGPSSARAQIHKEDYMKVREIMTIEVATASPDSTLEEVASMMKEEDAGAIPVLDDDQLVGIITDRDIVLRCIAEGKDPTETNVEDILTDNPFTIEPDADVDEAARLMSERQIRRLPVVEDGELLGVISLGDIAVKEPDEETAGDALEGVSQGVKRGQSQGGQRTSRKAQSASAGRTQSGGGQKQARKSPQSERSGRRTEKSRQQKVTSGRREARTSGRRRTG